MYRRGLILSAGLVAALLVGALFAGVAAKPGQRTGAKPCREGLLGIVGMLDAKLDDTADYRRTFTAIVETCGPLAPPPKPIEPPPDRSACRDLAMAMVDLIEDDKLNTAAFVTARDRFAQTCPPR
jgi:hypothetical protein